MGLTYRELEEKGIIMPVLENKSKYLAPARYDELLRIVTTIRERPGVRIRFEYEIYNGAGKLIHTAETQLVFMNKQTGRPCQPPLEMQEILEPFFK